MVWLKIILWVAAICCLLGFVGAALPWKAVAAMCAWVDFDVSKPTPMGVFLYRICSVVCGLIGVYFVILARNPLKYGAMLPLAGYGMALYGLLCLAGGIRYGLVPWNYAGDAVFGIIAGAYVVWFARKSESDMVQEPGSGAPAAPAP